VQNGIWHDYNQLINNDSEFREQEKERLAQERKGSMLADHGDKDLR